MIPTRREELCGFRNSGELSDICITVDKIEFHLHKFPLFLNSEFFRALCRCGMMDENTVTLPQFPGGVNTFSLIADYCYAQEIDINSKNVVELRCAAEFLQMTSLASETTTALTRILRTDPASVADTLSTACHLGAIADQTNVLSLCFNAVITLMKKGTISENILEVLLQLPAEWFVDFIVRARDAGITVSKITRLAGKYLEMMVREHKISIYEHLEQRSQRREIRDCVIRSDTMSAEEFGEIMDTILLELPTNASLSKVIEKEMLCLLYRLAVQLKCKCEGTLLSVISNNLCAIPREILVTMPTNDVVSIVEHSVNSNVISPTMLCEIADRYLWERTKQKQITLDEFDAVVRAIPKSHRPQHDSLLLIAEKLFSSEKVSEERKLTMLDLIDKYKLHEETLRHVSERNVIPSAFIVSSALAVSSRLRNELIQVKAKLVEKDHEAREIHANVREVIQGQWECNDVTVNVTPRDSSNTKVQFAKVLARNTSSELCMEHEVYDGRLTLCVQSRATSTHPHGTSTKTFLFDPFDEQLIELTRSKHNNLMVGEHYEKKKHTSSYWPFTDLVS